MGENLDPAGHSAGTRVIFAQLFELSGRGCWTCRYAAARHDLAQTALSSAYTIPITPGARPRRSDECWSS